MPSSVRFTVSSGMKWREQSSIRPRQGKRGRSLTTTAGTRNAVDEPGADQLQERLHAAQHAPRLGRLEHRALGVDR